MRRLFIASFVLSLIACGVGPKPTDDDPIDDTGDTTSTGTTVSDLQDGTVPEGETVTLTGVVVTSGWDGAGKGFFIQDAGGGEYSGIYVYAPSASDLFLEPGNVLTITGDTVEYYDWTEFSVADTSAIQVTGSADVTVDSVDPSTVSDWEVWESCLISVGAAEAAGNINGYGEIELTNGLVVDDWFYEFSGEQGATWTNVQGPLIYNFESWKLAPRDENDMQGYVEGEGPDVVTVGETQTLPTGTAVAIEGAVVSSPPLWNADKERYDGFFIQDAGGGSGVYVYSPGVSEEDAFVGATLNLTGATVEYYDLTEIENADLEWLGATADVVATEVGEVPGDWEAYEGMLVRFDAVDVTGEASHGEVESSLGINIDDLFTDSPALGTYASVTGIVNYSYGAFTLCPRGEDDIVQ